MESSREETLPAEKWLLSYIAILGANRDSLREGVYENAKQLLSSIECGPLPPATLRISNECFLIHWSNKKGDCLSVSFVGPRHFRYRITGGERDSGRQIVKSRHVERLRRLIAKVYDVNHCFADSVHLDFGKGMRI